MRQVFVVALAVLASMEQDVTLCAATIREISMLFRRAVLAGLSALALVPFAAHASDLPDLGGKSVVVVTENAYPPLQFVDPKSGQQIGWEYDAMAEIAKRLNITVKYENISWDAMIPAVSEGQYDLGMTGITIKEDRKEKVDFSDAYMRSEMLMIVRGDEERFTDAASFAANADLLMAAQPGTHIFIEVPAFMASDPANIDALCTLHANGSTLLLKGRIVTDARHPYQR